MQVAKTAAAKTSDTYKDNRSFSQVLGWVVLACFIVIGIIIYTATQCTMPLTYYHAKYFKFYRAAEEAEFDDEMKQKVSAVLTAFHNYFKNLEVPNAIDDFLVKLETDLIVTA